MLVSLFAMLSIIIPTKNRRAILEETLLHIGQSDFPKGADLDVIVVNDGDDDLSDLENESRLSLRVFKNERSGAASARNWGANNAKYELLLFLDDDILPFPDSLIKIIERHETRPDSVLSGTWEYSPQVEKHLQTSPFGRFKIENDYVCMGGIEKEEIAPNLFRSESLASFCLSLSKKTFGKIGGFNEDFPFAGCEDQEFSIKALSLGFDLLYSTEIKTFHNELDRADREKWLMRQYTGVQGYPLLCELFPARKEAALYRENIEIQKEDNLALKIKKAVKRIGYGKIGFFVTKVIADLSEKLSAPSGFLNRIYSLMGGMMLYQGFQVGEKSYRDRELRSNSN